MVWSIVMCLLGRAANIFPLALLCNKFREHKITRKMMFIMWFSGMYTSRFQKKVYVNMITAMPHKVTANEGSIWTALGRGDRYDTH